MINRHVWKKEWVPLFHKFNIKIHKKDQLKAVFNPNLLLFQKEGEVRCRRIWKDLAFQKLKKKYNQINNQAVIVWQIEQKTQSKN